MNAARPMNAARQTDGQRDAAHQPMAIDDDAIVGLLTRLARPHPSGGHVIERSAILASGADCASVVAWILAHAGAPEALTPQTATRGLHGGRVTDSSSARRPPQRLRLPAGVLVTRGPAYATDRQSPASDTFLHHA